MDTRSASAGGDGWRLTGSGKEGTVEMEPCAPAPRDFGYLPGTNPADKLSGYFSGNFAEPTEDRAVPVVTPGAVEALQEFPTVPLLASIGNARA